MVVQHYVLIDDDATIDTINSSMPKGNVATANDINARTIKSNMAAGSRRRIE
ncbi:hypothetical protein Tcan_03721 [Toxocara canis]|uniref:Uncharacterized protein n=1 Tax=Toxocara canis TaxID=6265 RepID=A0A0B2VBK3_TOXCA|nr:hypothetical protein Tcan_03721 [Toxocara canis]